METTKAKNNASDHLANERTFLAWIRTSIGIMAFGFVVVKFTLFIRELGYVLKTDIGVQQHGYTSFMGVGLVAFGALIGLLSFVRYKKVAGQLDNEMYRHDRLLTAMLAIFTLLAGLLLVVYLVHSVWG